MASGWAPEGAVQDQIDATLNDAVQRVRQGLTGGVSAQYCQECGDPIPEPRRAAPRCGAWRAVVFDLPTRTG